MRIKRWTRREFIGAAGASLVAVTRARAQRGSLTLTALGQSLILRDLATQGNSDYEAIRRVLAPSDVRFTNLETSIRGRSARDAVARPMGVVSDPVVLDSLKRLPIELLALASNHAYDLGEAGLISTIEEVESRRFTYAGTGRNLDDARRPALRQVTSGTVALVALASSALPTAAMATASHAGVNHLAERLDIVNADDSARVLAAIRSAASRSAQVIVYQHDHYWATDWRETPEWKKQWCRACIDAGASIYVSHGVPLLHGIEVYKGHPIFYGLGNFVFHISLHLSGNVPDPYLATECWQSVMASCEFSGGTVRAITLVPITLKSAAGIGDGQYPLHGNPMLARAEEAQAILERLRGLSKPLGTDVAISGAVARVKIQ